MIHLKQAHVRSLLCLTMTTALVIHARNSPIFLRQDKIWVFYLQGEINSQRIWYIYIHKTFIIIGRILNIRSIKGYKIGYEVIGS